MENNAITIKGYIACLGLWNEGIDHGRWVEFPISADDFNDVLAEIGCNAENEEYFFPEWESPVRLGEYETYDRVNDIAERLADLDEDEEIVEAILDEFSCDIVEGLTILENHDYMVYDNCDNMADVAYNVIEESYGLSGHRTSDTDFFLQYFDYEAYGRDLELDGHYIKYINGYIAINY